MCPCPLDAYPRFPQVGSILRKPKAKRTGSGICLGASMEEVANMRTYFVRASQQIGIRRTTSDLARRLRDRGFHFRVLTPSFFAKSFKLSYLRSKHAEERSGFIASFHNVNDGWSCFEHNANNHYDRWGHE